MAPRVDPDVFQVTKLYPCASCGRGFDEHAFVAPMKCLFGAGQWAPMEIIRATGSQHKKAYLNMKNYEEALLKQQRALESKAHALEDKRKRIHAIATDAITKVCKHVDDEGKSVLAQSRFLGAHCPYCHWNDY